jgi:copper resistance protein D
MTIDALWLSQVVIGALADMAFACTLGATLMNAWLSKDNASAAVSSARFGLSQAHRAGFSAALVLATADVVLVWLQAASMSGVPVAQAFAPMWLVITTTHAGLGWMITFAGSVLLVCASASARPMHLRRLALFCVGAVVAAAGKAAIGHAADAGAFSVAEIVQTLHLLATGVWGGVVIAGAWAVLPALQTSLARAFLIRTMARMSMTSLIAVFFVVATGIFNALRGLGGSMKALEDSTWGHVLGVKVTLVLAALILGAMSRWSALPRLQRTASTLDAHTVTNIMRLEALLIMGVFVAAAVLSHSAPGFSMAN